jgi:hypothetical protein
MQIKSVTNHSTLCYVFPTYNPYWLIYTSNDNENLRDVADTLGSGVDVMITIVCDFCQFSAKKLAFFSKANVMLKFLQKNSSMLFEQKRHFFGEKFGENI